MPATRRRRSSGENSSAGADGQVKAAAAEREATRRIVLERVRVVVLPDDAEVVGGVLDAISKIVPVPEPESVLAWRECGEFDGTVVHAIEQYAGKPGSAEARVGIFKAPPMRGWRGGVEHTQPPLPKVERRVIK